MKIFQKEITGTQTSFFTNFGGKLSFILCFMFPERLHCCYIYFHCSNNCYNYSRTNNCYNYSRTLCIKYWVSHFILRFNKISFLCGYQWKRGWGSKEEEIGGETEGDFIDKSDILEQFLCWFLKKENSDFGSNSEDQTQFKSGLGYLDWNQWLIVG
jgi:hypothetical protein